IQGVNVRWKEFGRSAGKGVKMPSGFPRLWVHLNRHAEPYQVKQLRGIPVGQAEAPVGFGASDHFRVRGSMDAISGAVKTDPCGAHRIVWPRGQHEPSSQPTSFLRFRKHLRIKKVVWILGDG